jgi:putative phage-type endonuclease
MVDIENIKNFLLTEKEEEDIVDTLVQLMYDYIDENPCEITEPDFEDEMMDHIHHVLLNTHDIFNKNILASIPECIDELMDVALDLFYMYFIPPRSFPSFVFQFEKEKKSREKINSTLSHLSSKPQPVQRTAEWYLFRHNLITASNAYKAFESTSLQNQLIYEKCQPFTGLQSQSFVNVDSTLHWGQKYEPISVLFYEEEYKAKVGDFGCIQHEQHSFLGASPDGIVVDPLSPRYGRMLEIKNIVNREIDGIPKKEYWIQMQLQMETCDLDACDFLETRFQEYENEEAFLLDSLDVESTSLTYSQEGERKGIMIYFSTKEGKPVYVYKPLNMEKHDFALWEQEIMSTHESLGYTWIKNIYWKLEEYSCVLVLRNKKWFLDNIYTLETIWKTIEQERISGYEHRAPNKRIPKQKEESQIHDVKSWSQKSFQIL